MVTRKNDKKSVNKPAHKARSRAVGKRAELREFVVSGIVSESNEKPRLVEGSGLHNSQDGVVTVLDERLWRRHIEKRIR